MKNRIIYSLFSLATIISITFSALGVTPVIAAPKDTMLQFDGTNDYVTFGQAAGLSNLGVQVFTIELWFKKTGTGVTTYTGSSGIVAVPLVTKGMAESDNSIVDMNYFFGIDTSGVLAADFEECAPATSGCPSGGTAGLNHPVKGTTSIQNNTWYHAAVTYDGRYWKIYLNGVLETMTGADVGATRYPRWDSTQHAALGTALQSSGSPGSSSGYGPGYFAGSIDEVRIWNVARTQAQIQADMNNELTSGTGLIGRWGLNEGTGTTATNSIAGRPNGTLTNGPTWVTTDLTPPAAPTGLSATGGSSLVNLNWTANTEPDLAGYNLYRSTTMGGPYTKVNTPVITGTTYTDTGRTNGTPYYYILRAVDISSNESGNSSEVTATPAEAATGLQFDGTNDYVTFGNGTGLGVTNFTLETWFYWTGGGVPMTTSGTQGLPSVIPLISKGRGEADGDNRDMNYFLGIDTATKALAVDFEDMATGMNYPFVGTTEVTVNTWHHAAVTYDSTNAVYTLYLDGNPAGTKDIGTNILPRSDSIQHAGIASAMTSTGSPAGYFQGKMDEVRIWNVARSVSEIRSTANSQTTSGTGLVARWSMGEGSGVTINSSVGTFPGTLTNGPTFVAGAPFNLVFDTVPPAAPTNMMSSPRPGAVQLEWTANTEMDLAGYRIYRSTTSPVVKGTPINGTLLAPSYVDNGVTAGITYYYAVSAVDTSNNESDLSNEASAVPLPPPPAEALDLGSAQAYVPLGDNADLSQFTLETWVRRDGTGTATTTGSGGVDLIPLITNGTAEAETAAADINYFFGIRGSDGVLCADFEEAQTGASPGLNHPICGTHPLSLNTWYHVAATYSGTVWRLYLNGSLEAELSVGQPANAANTSQLALGTSMKTDNTALGFFDGALDEVRIWNIARTQTQIINTINTKLPSPQTGLVGRWGLDEASGIAVTDSSGNSINGTITGSGSSWVAGSPFNATVNLAPEAPVLVSPANGASNVPTTTALSVTVTDPEAQTLDVTFYGRPLQAAAGPDFTLIAIPDPQYYASTYPSIYDAQMQWVNNNKTAENIAFVASLGDNVDVASDTTQWANADHAWDILDLSNVPYGLAVGNHDGAPSNTGNFNVNFGTSRFSGKTWYGGHYGSDNDNHYALFSASGLDFIMIFIEYDDSMTSTSHPVLQWANDLLQTHSTRRAIVVSHNLLSGNNFSTQGQTIYNALKANPNLFLMLGGHLDVAGQRSDTYLGNTVYTLRSDYQTVDNRQSGYLRIMRFSPADDMIYIRTYSPTQNKDYDKSDAAQNNFNLPYAMDGTGFSVIGTANDVASGGTASVDWAGLNPDEQYEWFVIASDGTHQTPSDTWNFTTAPVAPTCYALTLSHTGQGTDPIANPSNSTGCPANQYVSGESISLSNATPATGWQISGWTGTANNASTDSTNSLTMPASAHSASVTYTELNAAPIAVDDTYNTNEDVQRNVGAPGVLENDTDADPLTAVLVDSPATGDLIFNPDGSFTYTPIPHFHGTVTFTYKANDGTADSNVATVTINVIPNEYTLTVNANSHVTVTKTPNKSTYHYGDVVQLLASADPGWTFNSWSGDVGGNTNPLDLTITGDMNIDANFDPPIQRFHVQLTPNNVVGFDWTLDDEITMTIDDISTGPGVDITRQAMVQVAEWDPNSTVVYFNDVGGIDLEAGDIVTMTDGNIVKTHTVTILALTSVDPDTDTITGTAAPGAPVHAGNMCDRLGCAYREILVGGNGNWSFNFAVPGTGQNDFGLFNIKQGSTGEIIEPDEDGDHTDIDWGIYNPSLTAHPDDDRVEGSYWPLGANVTLNINGTDIETKPVGSAPWNPNETYVEFILATHDLVVGDVVTLSDGTTTKEHTVFDLAVTNVDATADTVAGTTNQSYDIYFWVHPGVDGSFKTLAPTAGNWIAYFNPFDLVPGNTGPAVQCEDDGDCTWVEWWVAYTLTIVVNGSGEVVSTPSGIGYRPDSNVQLQANADAGWSFSGWSGDLVSTDNPVTVTMNANKTITATFEDNTPPPPLPSSFYGEIHVLDTPPSAGDTVDIFLPGLGTPITSSTIFSDGPNLVYVSEVPGDIAGTPTREGAVQGEALTFKIGSRTVATALWQTGTNVALNIHPPQALPGGPYAGTAGSPISFSGSANDWGTDATTYQWDWDNDGIYDETAQNPSHTFANFGNYTVGIKVTDAKGGEGTATTTVGVSKAASITTVTCDAGPFVFTGAAQTPCSATVTGAGGLNQTLTVSYSNNINAGTATATASFAGDANHEASSDSKNFSITPASATITLSDMTQVYDGTPKSATVTTNPAGRSVSVTYNGSSTAPTAPGSYAVVATITDPNYTGTANGTFVIQAKHSIALVQGWNLVSFNVRPSNTAVASVLSSLNGNYNLVYAWDATGARSASGNWMKYDPTGPSFQNSLSTLDETMGFWIYMTAADTLDVIGSEPVTTNVALLDNVGGWNLVSYASMSNRSLPAALQSNGVGTDFSLVYSYRANDATDPWKLFDRTGPSFANDLTTMTPGWGYWIKVNADRTWNVKYLPD